MLDLGKGIFHVYQTHNSVNHVKMNQKTEISRQAGEFVQHGYH